MYDVMHCVYEPKLMSKEQLEEGFIRAWKDTYTTGNIARRILRPNLLLPLAVATNAAYRNYGSDLLGYDRDRMVDNRDICGEDLVFL